MTAAAQTPPADQDIAAWIDAQPRQLTYSELAAACQAQFGPCRAWGAERLRAYWVSTHPAAARSPIDRDGELVAFFRERIGRRTVEEMLAECREHHPTKRIPSRSALHRWTQRERGRRAIARVP